VLRPPPPPAAAAASSQTSPPQDQLSAVASSSEDKLALERKEGSDAVLRPHENEIDRAAASTQVDSIEHQYIAIACGYL
jgi:hypothetical protein